jgi:hypothetical protein
MMRRRWFVGLVTILSGLAGLMAPLVFVLLGLRLSALLLVMTMLAFLLRGVAGTVGGVLVWRGKRLGYQLAALSWSYLVIVGTVALVQLFTASESSAGFLARDSRLFWRAVGASLGKLLWGIPFLCILVRDLRRHGRESVNDRKLEA